MRWLIGLVGAAAGTASGLVVPVVVLGALHVGSGSYEDVLLPWMVTVPGGAVVGGWLGARLGAKLASR